jgi:hypothetical protein
MSCYRRHFYTIPDKSHRFLRGATAQTSQLEEADTCFCDNGVDVDDAASKICCSDQSESNSNLKFGSIGQCDTKTLVEDGGMGMDVDDFKSCCIDQGVGDSEKSATCVEG